MNLIKEAREAAGYSQKQVAIELKVSAPTISQWESGKKYPSTENLIKLANLFHVTVDYLLGREEIPVAAFDGDYDNFTDAQISILEEIKNQFLEFNKKVE